VDKQPQIDEWSRLYGRQISEEEYREICDNLKAFFDLLIEADKQILTKPKDGVSL